MRTTALLLAVLLAAGCATAEPHSLAVESLLLQSDCETGRKPAAECPKIEVRK